MAVMDPTTNYNWNLPNVGADIGAWGGLLNTIIGDNVTGIDAVVKAVSNVANAALPKAGGTMTGGLVGTTAAFSGAITQGGTAVSLAGHGHAAGDITSGTLADARIPGLAASKITSGTFDAARIPGLPGSIITSGTVPAARLGSGTPDGTSYLRGDGVWASPPAGVTGSGALNSYARWTGTGSIGARTPAEVLSDIGAAASSHTHDTSHVTSGTFADARIPALDTSKITSGVFADARIPNLDTAKVTTGTFATARIPTISSSMVATDVARITVSTSGPSGSPADGWIWAQY